MVAGPSQGMVGGANLMPWWGWALIIALAVNMATDFATWILTRNEVRKLNELSEATRATANDILTYTRNHPPAS